MQTFDRIADRYNQLWLLSESYQQWMLQQCVQKLELTSTDQLVDLDRLVLPFYESNRTPDEKSYLHRAVN